MLISIITSSGKISAGTVSFNATEDGRLTLPLKRCSDKSASISLQVECAKVHKIRDIESLEGSPKEGNDSPILGLKAESIARFRMPALLSKNEQSSTRKDNSNSQLKGLNRSTVKRDHLDSRLK